MLLTISSAAASCVTQVCRKQTVSSYLGMGPCARGKCLVQQRMSSCSVSSFGDRGQVWGVSPGSVVKQSQVFQGNSRPVVGHHQQRKRKHAGETEHNRTSTTATLSCAITTVLRSCMHGAPMLWPNISPKPLPSSAAGASIWLDTRPSTPISWCCSGWGFSSIPEPVRTGQPPENHMERDDSARDGRNRGLSPELLSYRHQSS